MKVKELVERLRAIDADLDVLCCVDGNNALRLFDIVDLRVVDAKKERLGDDRPVLKLGHANGAEKHVLLEITEDF
jgi:hypothetical protein